MTKTHTTDLIIIGAGAAGLMAGVAAGEAGLRSMIVERKHKPGRKLLLCGNNRCNLTSNITAEQMLKGFGHPCDRFLRTTIQAFSPANLQRWFSINGLPTAVCSGNRVYPKSQKADDVLHLFRDRLRDLTIPMLCSAPVEALESTNAGFIIQCPTVTLSAKYILLATGGISYPKTGSVGDGQRFAAAMGHPLQPFRPGLAAVDLPPDVTSNRINLETTKAKLHIIDANDQRVASTFGDWKFTATGIEGTAISNATRIVSRLNLTDYQFELDYPDGRRERITPTSIRPIKEAMVTVGGVDLSKIDPDTMESKLVKNCFFAGEIMDIDGPSGGYNLNAAFATARLAIHAIAARLGKTLPPLPKAKQAATRSHRPRKSRANARPVKRHQTRNTHHRRSK